MTKNLGAVKRLLNVYNYTKLYIFLNIVYCKRSLIGPNMFTLHHVILTVSGILLTVLSIILVHDLYHMFKIYLHEQSFKDYDLRKRQSYLSYASITLLFIVLNSTIALFCFFTAA